METLITVMICIVSVGGLSIIYWIMSREWIYRQFVKNVSEEDMVNIYIGEDKLTAEILYLGEIYVDVICIYGKKRVLRSDIYPISGYCYKKDKKT